MVSNLVSNSRMGACAKGYTGIAYISLTREWYYEVRQVAVAACIDGKGGSSEWQLDVCT